MPPAFVSLLAKHWLWLVVLLGLMLPAPARAAATGWIGDEHAAVRLISASEATGSAARLDLGLEFRLAPGWHIYWRSPGDAGFPPSIAWDDSDNLASASLAWPAPRRMTLLGFETMGYESGTVLPITVAVKQAGAPLRAEAGVDYLACAEICVPYEARLSLALPSGPAGPGSEAPLLAAAARKVPGPAAAAGITALSARVSGSGKTAVLSLAFTAAPPLLQPDLFVEGLGDTVSSGAARLLLAASGTQQLRVPLAGVAPEAVAGQALTLTLVDGARSAEFSLTPQLAADNDSGTSLAAMLLVALLGGLILNVMPCVLPVLSLKLLAVTAHAGGARREIRLGFLASAAGILVSFLLLAGMALLARRLGLAVGWGIQFQQPLFLIAMIGFLTLFAASLLGLLAIGLPSAAARLGGIAAKRPLGDAFLTGAFATLLATPCSAPFVGTALGFALTGGSIEILSVFAAMGLGFALPYLLVALLPGLVRRLPRPGPWMIWAERLLGLLLAGTAVWLLLVLAAVAGPAAALATALGALLLALLLSWRSRSAGPARWRLGGAAAGLAVLLLALPALLPDLAAPRAAAASGQWRLFDAAERDRLVGEGKLVLVDVTADWCLTCKLNKAAVLDRGPVQERLAGTIVGMRADWTRPDAAISAYLASFERFGIPFNAVYGPAAPKGIALPEILTDSAVLAALDRAAGN